MKREGRVLHGDVAHDGESDSESSSGEEYRRGYRNRRIIQKSQKKRKRGNTVECEKQEGWFVVRWSFSLMMPGAVTQLALATRDSQFAQLVIN